MAESCGDHFLLLPSCGKFLAFIYLYMYVFSLIFLHFPFSFPSNVPHKDKSSNIHISHGIKKRYEDDEKFLICIQKRNTTLEHRGATTSQHRVYKRHKDQVYIMGIHIKLNIYIYVCPAQDRLGSGVASEGDFWWRYMAWHILGEGCGEHRVGVEYKRGWFSSLYGEDPSCYYAIISLWLGLNMNTRMSFSLLGLFSAFREPLSLINSSGMEKGISYFSDCPFVRFFLAVSGACTCAARTFYLCKFLA